MSEERNKLEVEEEEEGVEVEGISAEERQAERSKLKDLGVEDKSKSGWSMLANLTEEGSEERSKLKERQAMDDVDKKDSSLLFSSFSKKENED
jgi:hypothetical protein